MARSNEGTTMTTWICDDGNGGEIEIEAEAAREAAEEYVADGDWGDGDETLWIDVYVTPVVGGEPQEDERYAVTVTLEPDEPECHDGEDHDWKDGQVRGSGGGIAYTDQCQRCGLLRHVDTWHSRPDTGEQGMHYTRYEESTLYREEE